MASALDALQVLSNGPSRANAGNPAGYVQTASRRQRLLDELKRSMALAASSNGHMIAGATPADITELENDASEDPQTGADAQAHAAEQEKLYQEGVTYNRPDVTQQRTEAFANKLKLASAPAEIAAGGNLAVEHAKTEGAIKEREAQSSATQKLLETLGGGQSASGGAPGALIGPGGTIKPTINASGGVSFTTTQMPALVQRARNQLMDARDKTLSALSDAEKQYPGINDEANKVDATPPGSGSAFGRFFQGVSGIGAPKYGGPTDRAGAAMERANYTLGIATPFSKLAQEASFGNIEQMAGQLPGVRGLATITPLFKEHQSRWGHEAPLATVQRLRHMAEIMDGTLHTLDTSGAGGPEQD